MHLFFICVYVGQTHRRLLGPVQSLADWASYVKCVLDHFTDSEDVLFSAFFFKTV